VEPGTLRVDDGGDLKVTPATAPGTVTLPTVVDTTTGSITVAADTTAGTYVIYGLGTGDTLLFAEYFSVTLSPTTNAELKTAVTSGISTWGQTADLNYIITTAVTDMITMFANEYSFNGDISLWDTSAVTTMSNMFNFARLFNGDISGWDVSKVENMLGMFQNTLTFNGDISGWDVSSVTLMITMFRESSAFNQDLEEWGEHLTLNSAGKYTGTATQMFVDSGVVNGIADDPNTSDVETEAAVGVPSWYQ
ncbi:MAG: BspA family leucine-rich repeat surface protein, partial [Salinispira sp.]